MLGKPKYKYGDKVKFVINGKEVIGVIEIIDSYGTFEQHDEVSYDILADETNPITATPCLFKHIVETNVEKCE